MMSYALLHSNTQIRIVSKISYLVNSISCLCNVVIILHMYIADKHRVILSGEYPDYIHAVAANVSSLDRVME